MVESKNSGSPFSWGGRELRNNGQIRETMVGITDPAEAHAFITAFRDRNGINADVTVFQMAALAESRDQMVGLLNKFLGRDFSGEFFITEAPQDEYGNTANKPCIRKVRIAEPPVGKLLDLEILEPEEIAKGWPRVFPLAWRYFPVAGPARMLSRPEWKELVGFKDPV